MYIRSVLLDIIALRKILYFVYPKNFKLNEPVVEVSMFSSKYSLANYSRSGLVSGKILNCTIVHFFWFKIKFKILDTFIELLYEPICNSSNLLP